MIFVGCRKKNHLTKTQEIAKYLVFLNFDGHNKNQICNNPYLSEMKSIQSVVFVPLCSRRISNKIMMP